MLEFLQSHTNVVSQNDFDERGYRGINPYAFGFAMMRDIRRMCEQPTDEDRKWFPELAGTDWIKQLDFAMRNFKDESFIAQYPSPRLMREFHLFAVADHWREEHLEIDSIHDDEGYRRVRRVLAEQHQRTQVPDIQVARYEHDGDRSLTLHHRIFRERPVADGEARETLKHLTRPWGFNMSLEGIGEDGRVEYCQESTA